MVSLVLQQNPIVRCNSVTDFNVVQQKEADTCHRVFIKEMNLFTSTVSIE